MRPVSSSKTLAAVSIIFSALFATVTPMVFLLAADAPPLCNGKKQQTPLHDCYPYDMTGCSGRTQSQCPTRPCGDPDMIPYYVVVNQTSNCVANFDGWDPKKGWTTGCATVNKSLVCYAEYACYWDQNTMQCVPAMKICCRSITMDSYDTNYECTPGVEQWSNNSPCQFRGFDVDRKLIVCATSDRDRDRIRGL